MRERPKEKKDGTVEEDQKERGYYYDDAHGYEEFDPEDDEPEAERGTRRNGDAEIVPPE